MTQFPTESCSGRTKRVGPRPLWWQEKATDVKRKRYWINVDRKAGVPL